MSSIYEEMASIKPTKPTFDMAKSNGAPILVALDQHDAEVANLADEIYILLDKIGPVTGPERPEMADKSPGEIEVATSQVADRINTSSRTLSNLRNTIRSVRERVEL